MPDRLRSRRNERGFTSIEWLVAVAFSMIVMVVIINLIAVQYGRGVIRAAADEGARSGARVDIDQIRACQEREQNVLDSLGRMAEERSCRVHRY